MLEDPENLNILEGILGLGSAFHRQVIAEGVETVEHGLMLLRLGCELAQGYGIARPMPAADLHPGFPAGGPIRAGPRCLRSTPATEPCSMRAWSTVHGSRPLNRFCKASDMLLLRLDSGQCRFGTWLEQKPRRAAASNRPIALSIPLTGSCTSLPRRLLLPRPRAETAEELGRLDRVAWPRRRAS